MCVRCSRAQYSLAYLFSQGIIDFIAQMAEKLINLTVIETTKAHTNPCVDISRWIRVDEDIYVIKKWVRICICSQFFLNFKKYTFICEWACQAERGETQECGGEVGREGQQDSMCDASCFCLSENVHKVQRWNYQIKKPAMVLIAWRLSKIKPIQLFFLNFPFWHDSGE